MTAPKWLPWLGWALLAVSLAVSGVLYAQGQAARGEARMADSLASERLVEARRDSARADHLMRLVDRVDSVHALIRDSLNRARRALERESEEAETEAIAAGDSLEATLTALRPRVKAPLRPAVDTALVQTQALRSSYEAALSASREQIRATEALVTSCRVRVGVRDSAIQALEGARSSCSDALRAMRDARNRWRRIANPPIWERLFGNSFVEAGAIVGVNAAAWLWDPKAGAGATSLTLVRLAF